MQVVKGVAEAFTRSPNQFGYICGATQPVGFQDSSIAWSILYNVLATAENANASTMRNAIRKINAAISGDFVYRRWDEDQQRYWSYSGGA
jgi:hypothetical protein